MGIASMAGGGCDIKGYFPPGYTLLTKKGDGGVLFDPAHDRGRKLMSATIISLSEKRREREERERQIRIDAFDRELRRRLALYLDGDDIPVEPIRDNPYI